MNRFKEIFVQLQEAILNNDYQPGEKLPSENDLATQFGVSRETIRKALVLLAEQGFIQKQQGKGSFVLEQIKFDFPISGLTSYHELVSHQQIHSVTETVCLTKCISEKRMHPFFPFTAEQELWKVIRKRTIDQETVILDKDYLLTDYVPNLTETITNHSLYAYIEDVLKLDISYATKEITVEPVTKEDTLYLTLRPEDTFVVVVRSQVFLQDTTLFQYTESRHRLDKFKFTEFARRRH